jgi:hypothetical protein
MGRSARRTPLPTKDGGVLRTIGDVRAYMLALSEERQNLVHAALELLQLLGLEARAHNAQAVADAGADLTVEGAIRHGPDRLAVAWQLHLVKV